MSWTLWTAHTWVDIELIQACIVFHSIVWLDHGKSKSNVVPMSTTSHSNSHMNTLENTVIVDTLSFYKILRFHCSCLQCSKHTTQTHQKGESRTEDKDVKTHRVVANASKYQPNVLHRSITVSYHREGSIDICMCILHVNRNPSSFLHTVYIA